MLIITEQLYKLYLVFPAAGSNLGSYIDFFSYYVCAGDSFCHMTSHICISCPAPFEWVGGTQCVCPDGTVPTADGKGCVECLDDSDCTTLKEATSWYCDTGTNMCIHCPSPKEWHADTNTCECPSGTHIVRDSCICDNPNKTLVDGLCQCQIDQKSCSSSDFMGEINCDCCPDDKPVWNKASGELAQCVSCADVDATKPYYNSDTKMCEICPEPTPFWNSETKVCECPVSFGAIQGMGDGTQVCWPYCEEQEIGLIMFIDRSSSTRDTGYENYINSALASITVPDIYKVAAFLDRGEGQYTANQILSYDFYTN